MKTNTMVGTLLMAAALMVVASFNNTASASIGGTQSVTLEVPNGVTCGLVCTNNAEHSLTFIPGYYGLSEYIWGSFCNGDKVTASTEGCSVVATITVTGEIYGATDTATATSDAKTVTFNLSHSQSIEWDPIGECYIGHVDVGVSKSNETWCEAEPVD